MLRAAFVKALLAGGAVGVGGAVFLSCEDKAIGALFFSVALLSVCWMGLNLFTGKVGFMVESHKNADWLNLIMALVGNTLGACAVGFLISKGVDNVCAKCTAICEAKLAQTLPDALIRAFFCGILMYTAVWIFREKKTIVGILFCVPVFILAGFEHSIADMFYFTVAGIRGIDVVFYLTLIVLGNAVGGVFVPLMMNLAGEGGKAK